MNEKNQFIVIPTYHQSAMKFFQSYLSKVNRKKLVLKLSEFCILVIAGFFEPQTYQL